MSLKPNQHGELPGTQLKLRNDFNLLAPVYDWMAAIPFLGFVRRGQLALLSQLASCESVLIIGGGTGWFLLELLRRVQPKRVLYVEQSERMTRYSRELVQREAPELLPIVEFRQSTEQSLSPKDGQFDLVVTNFFLDLFSPENAVQVGEKLRQRLAPGGKWLVTGFQIPARGLGRWYAKAVFSLMFPFFRIFSNIESKQMPDYPGLLRKLGFEADTEQTFLGDIVHSSIYARRREQQSSGRQ